MKVINALKKILPPRLKEYLRKKNERVELENWIKNGNPVPPPHRVKQIAIKDYADRFDCNQLVETGTYLGDMVWALSNRFETIHSIELSEKLFERACKRFRKHENVFLYQGDSGKVLRDVCKKLEQPTIFWLDGHYSGGITARGDLDCPIYEELESILSAGIKHVILIDDARCFIGEGDYPSIDELSEFLKRKDNSYTIEVADDIIRCFV